MGTNIFWNVFNFTKAIDYDLSQKKVFRVWGFFCCLFFISSSNYIKLLFLKVRN